MKKEDMMMFVQYKYISDNTSIIMQRSTNICGFMNIPSTSIKIPDAMNNLRNISLSITSGHEFFYYSFIRFFKFFNIYSELIFYYKRISFNYSYNCRWNSYFCQNFFNCIFFNGNEVSSM